ncbi:MAG: recombination mediator RecR [Opitutales bacterium]|jgi:recombination protein RecR
MADAFEQLQQCLKRLPGLGYRSAERLALHLLVEQPDSGPVLVSALEKAMESIHACPECGNLCEGDLCEICTDASRDDELLCVVESVTDLRSMERAGAYRGRYHVLQGKLSPLHGVGPEHLNLEPLAERLDRGRIREVILALSNDIEGEATCHYIQQETMAGLPVSVSRIGFGLPSGGGIPYADSTTLRSALEGRRKFD